MTSAASKIMSRVSISMVVSALATVFALWFLLPGRMSDDSFAQLAQARANLFSDDHPPIMALIWRALDAISPGASSLVFVHVAMFALGCYILARAIDRNEWARVAIFLGLFFFAPTFALLGAAWKDISFIVSLVLAIALLYRSSQTNDAPPKPGWALMALVAAILWYAIGVRYNGIFAVFPLAVWLVWLAMRRPVEFRRRAIAVAAGALLCLGMFASHALIGRLVNATPTHFWQVSAVYDLTAISLQTREDLLDDALFPGSTLEEMDKYFVPNTVLRITQSAPFYRTLSSESDLNKLRSDWIGAIIEHPVVFLRHRLTLLRESIGITKARPWVPVLPQSMRGEEVVADAANPAARAFLLRLDEIAPITLAYRPWAHIVLATLILIFLFGVGSDRRGLMAITYVTAVANYASLFLLAHSPDFRFALPMLFASALATVLAGRETLRLVLNSGADKSPSTVTHQER